MSTRKKMTTLGVALLASTAVSGVIAVACTKKADPVLATDTTETTGASYTTTTSWQIITRDWPQSSRDAAKEMSEKYGAPDEVTATQLVWHKRGPWKKSVLSKEEVPHAWPNQHVDVLEQVIDYKVPADRFDELAMFDGSVMAERTKGELSARCGGEAANFLAINLAKDILDGQRSPEEARAYYEATMKAYKAGAKNQDYMTHLRFGMPSSPTNDLDKPAF